MRIDTEDPLTLRDGDPMDAERKTRVLADADRVREIARLEQMRSALRGLPELPPPPGVWQRIAGELERRPAAHGPLRLRRIGSRAAAAAVGGAVLVALAAAMIGDRAGVPSIRERVAAIEPVSGFGSTKVEVPLPDVDTEPLRAVADSTESAIEPADAEENRAERDEAERFHAAPPDAASTRMDRYAALAAESARLERALGRIRFQPEVMNAGTAGTIVGLEDTLAALDEQLTFAAAGGADPHERETLWRERVNVMRALVQVRYAQAQRSGL
jgi:hypothetical protein